DYCCQSFDGGNYLLF
nr:immunoglobulin light chain junction region [Macaca mulatta]